MTPATPTLALLLALLAAALFGMQSVLARRALRYMDAQTGAMVTIVVSAAVFWCGFIWQAPTAAWGSPALWVFVSNGLIHPMLSMLLSFEANRRMGATVSATIAGTAPLFATLGAIVGLAEVVSLETLLGTLGIVAGVIVLSWSRGARRHWPLAALFFPVGTALVRAFNHVWGRFGMLLLPAPLFAATMSFTVSGALSVLVYRVRTGGLPRGLPRRGLVWAGLGGIVVAIAILAMYTALSLGRVVIVSPVLNTYPLFTLSWSLLFREERFSRRILAGVVLVVGGVALIGLR